MAAAACASHGGRVHFAWRPRRFAWCFLLGATAAAAVKSVQQQSKMEEAGASRLSKRDVPHMAQQPALIVPPLQHMIDKQNVDGRTEAITLVKRMVGTLEAIDNGAKENIAKTKRHAPEYMRMVQYFRKESGEFDKRVEEYSYGFGHVVLGHLCDAELRKLIGYANQDPRLRKPVSLLLQRRGRHSDLYEEYVWSSAASLDAAPHLRRAAQIFEAMDQQAERDIINTVRPSPAYGALAAQLSDDEAVLDEVHAATIESGGRLWNSEVANLLARRFDKNMRRLNTLSETDPSVRDDYHIQQARKALSEQRERLAHYWARRRA